MNSYIWLSLETRKEVEITKEGLVIHHHPDMCPYGTATIQENSRGQTETKEKNQKKHLIGSCVTIYVEKKHNNRINSCVVKEQRGKYGTDSWALRAPG